ncbi:60S ribosomal subunit biogenesis GTPase LSG1 [Metarhizium robertsii]|uniref:GTP-binding protein, HSR-1 related protein n=2 Tax=Metarhizium robertsii TaxID=568076 RepID=E9FAY6_METRA|nr:GTP-binding protein, HSR-1 related protein [Metarhizium robertsii ARSEF 23]EFY95108.1 GTP-binding protein, HSR-1 related protein [Metarhizium robertsii ARSEF 23]EXU96557.1 60S ribosomal subunit biogenesis GTPase LSG1 [Metarhizium robertsii]
MVLAKSKKSVGLGNTLMNDRFGKGKGSDRKKQSAITRTNHATGEQYLVNEKQDASWVKMRSVTEQGALDEFLATAELAGTDFTAEKMNNVKIIHTDQKNPYLLSANEERTVLGKHKMHRGRLTVPRRPHWDSTTTPQELDSREREAFLSWRRGLAELEENNDLLMTPFERNLEVWRQLWRVIERSDLIVQIVDARNPLLFRSEDLEIYVKDVDPKKENLLLINKADMMTLAQRRAWAKHLKKAGIAYKFFSAQLAKELNEARDEDGGSEDEVEKPSSHSAGKQPATGEDSSEEESEDDGGAPTAVDEDEDTQILTVEELEDIFLQHSPKDAASDHKLQVGLVGYPNVGKSSTINALIGAKKVSVSSTPGKTKHFQTIHLSENVILCDCPGLVFPNFAFTKADLVCNGVLPIDQMREYTGPVGLVTQRIPQRFLEAIYGIQIKTRPLEEGGSGIPTAEELLRAYARARGFQTQGLGQPDEARASRYVLKDYVNGKLLFVHPPPGIEDAKAFNRELYSEFNLPEKRRAALAAATEAMSLKDDDSVTVDSDMISIPAGPKTEKLDARFFGPDKSQGHISMPFNHKYTEQGQASGRMLTGRKARTVVALENGIDPKDVQLLSSKKHFKGGAKNGKSKKHRYMNTDD